MRIALLLIALAGCGGGGQAEQDMAIPDLALAASADLTLPAPDMAHTVDVTVQLSDFTSKNPIVGAKVCLLPDTMNCATSDVVGTAMVKAPPMTDIAISIDGSPMHDRVITTIGRRNSPLTIGYIIETAAEAAAHTAAFFTLSDDTGAVHLQAGNFQAGGLAGATFALVPSTGKGPFYADAQYMFDRNLTATSSTGLAAIGELPAGDYEAEATLPMGMTCTAHPAFAWAGSVANRSKFPIKNGFTTLTAFNCQ